jgi:hypothetical protein
MSHDIGFETDGEGQSKSILITEFDLEEVERELDALPEDVQAEARAAVAHAVWVMLGYCVQQQHPKMTLQVINYCLSTSDITMEQIAKEHGMTKQAVDKEISKWAKNFGVKGREMR